MGRFGFGVRLTISLIYRASLMVLAGATGHAISLKAAGIFMWYWLA